MKLQFSTSVILALDLGSPVLSLSDHVQHVHAATVDRPKTIIYTSNINEYEDRLRAKLRAKLSLKKKSRVAGKSLEPDEYCTPVTVKLSFESVDDGLDLGILGSVECLNPSRKCVPDASSKLGGRCTESDEDWLINADLIQGVDTGSLDFPEVQFIGGECKLATEGTSDHPDLGILYQCSNPDDVCVENESSPNGGVCVEEGILYDDVDETTLVRGHRHLMECDYRNGTLGGMKCSGSLACAGLSPTFISYSIGCGSCNGAYCK